MSLICPLMRLSILFQRIYSSKNCMLRSRKTSVLKISANLEYAECPAKTFTDGSGEVFPGRNVPVHCNIVGEVARELIARIPPLVADVLYPEGSPLVAAMHDIGKVSPSFVEKIRQACTAGHVAIPENPKFADPKLERQWGGHAGVSQITAKAMGAPGYLAAIIGQHHGFSPPVQGKLATDELFGGPEWYQERQALVSYLKKQLCMDWPDVSTLSQARLLSGLTSVADWIGSGALFEDPSIDWRGKIVTAVDDAGFQRPVCLTGLTFEDVFGFQAHASQRALIDHVTGPGVYLLEAPMGQGKTEAALYSAYKVLEAGKATGIYFALPTQLTSNKMLERFSTFLSAILEDGTRHRALLLHGHAHLLEQTEMGEEGRPGGAFFHHTKRGLLAPFAVGTVDQALMAAMNVKHGFVRAFGLAGKVVILDEVHTYDSYTGTLLDALVALLSQLQCTVIILSATLDPDRRRDLLGSSVPGIHYPLMTARPYQQDLIEVPVKAATRQTVTIHHVTEDRLAVEQALERALRGELVLWIENTVVDAQSIYLYLAARCAELSIECGLIHSRFTHEHRQQLENIWVGRYGKSGWEHRQTKGMILVGTQVLEQSLDIDADFLVSRFAPTDLLLQRMGRLWRHDETPRSRSAICEIWLLVPEFERAMTLPYQAFGSSAHVYAPFILCRSLEIWRERTSVCLPEDIRSLVTNTYCHREEQGVMARLLHDLEEGTPHKKGRKALRSLASITLSENGNTLPESRAQTRYSDMDSSEVLLLRSIYLQPEHKHTKLSLLNGQQLRIPWGRHQLRREEWRQLSTLLMKQVVTVSTHDAPNALSLELLMRFGLQHCFYLGSPQENDAILRVALVEHDACLSGVHGYALHEKHTLEYRSDLGYRVVKS